MTSANFRGNEKHILTILNITMTSLTQKCEGHTKAIQLQQVSHIEAALGGGGCWPH